MDGHRNGIDNSKWSSMEKKLVVKETIVCEGKNDVQAIRQGIEGNFIITSGFGLRRETIEQIRKAQNTTGVIVLTDPDFMGERIREIINKKVPGVKNAFISRSEGRDRDDIGVENASPESIIRALEKARCLKVTEEDPIEPLFIAADLYSYGLTGGDGSERRREPVS